MSSDQPIDFSNISKSYLENINSLGKLETLLGSLKSQTKREISNYCQSIKDIVKNNRRLINEEIKVLERKIIKSKLQYKQLKKINEKLKCKRNELMNGLVEFKKDYLINNVKYEKAAMEYSFYFKKIEDNFKFILNNVKEKENLDIELLNLKKDEVSLLKQIEEDNEDSQFNITYLSDQIEEYREQFLEATSINDINKIDEDIEKMKKKKNDKFKAIRSLKERKLSYYEDIFQLIKDEGNYDKLFYSLKKYNLNELFSSSSFEYIFFEILKKSNQLKINRHYEKELIKRNMSLFKKYMDDDNCGNLISKDNQDYLINCMISEKKCYTELKEDLKKIKIKRMFSKKPLSSKISKKQEKQLNYLIEFLHLRKISNIVMSRIASIS